MSNPDTFRATNQWLAKIGRLRPWEVSDTNKALRNYTPAYLRRLMALVAEQVGKSLREPLTASDVETILSIAADISGMFAGVEDARCMAHEFSDASWAWTLVLAALDGESYESLVALIEAKA